MEFSMKDMYRASIEHATGGRNTVMYDDYGCPNVMVCIPRFDVSILGEEEFGYGAHPAFNVDGRIVNEIWVGKYSSSDMGGVPVSLKGKAPIYGDASAKPYSDRIRKKGKGWHIMTNSEWAAMMLPPWRRGIRAHGNTGPGTRDVRNQKEMGGEVFMHVAGSGDPTFIYTGTGPDTYAHDRTPYGVFDVIGNQWEYVSGLNIHAWSGSIIWTCDDEGQPCNSPFIEDIDVGTFAFQSVTKTIDSVRIAKGYAYPGIHFVPNGNKWKISTASDTANYKDVTATMLDSVGVTFENGAEKYEKILKQLCVIPSMGYTNSETTKVWAHIVRHDNIYACVSRGGRNGDSAQNRTNPFCFDMWRYSRERPDANPDTIFNPNYTGRICYVDL